MNLDGTPEPIEEIAKTPQQLLKEARDDLVAVRTLLVAMNNRVNTSYLFIALLIFGGIFGGFVYWKQLDDNHRAIARTQAVTDCMREWANKTTERSRLLVVLNKDRDTKFDKLFREAGLNNPQLNRQNYNAWLAADNAYAKAVADNPIPDSPNFICPAIPDIKQPSTAPRSPTHVKPS